MATTGDIIFDELEKWDVEVVFGLPGDGINGLMEALRTRQERIRFVCTRHEEAAAFMATGYAKFTGRLGVCLATSGPGAVHLLNGLYDAKLDGAPVLAITGQTYSDLIGSRYQQEVDVLRLFDDVADYNIQVNSPEHAKMVVDMGCRTAVSRRAVAHLNIPIDVQEATLQKEYTRNKIPGHTAAGVPALRVRPPKDEVARAAEILQSSRRPLILAGSGARGASAEVIQLAERLQAPIVKPLLGKDIIPDMHPLCLGGAGLLGTAPSQKALEECDALLMVGTSFPYMQYLPKPGTARAIQVDIDPQRIGLRYPVDVGLVGDAQSALQELLPLVPERAASDWMVGLQGDMRDWWGLLEGRGTREDMPMKPQVVAWELDKLLRDDAIITGDAGTIATWAARYLRIRGSQRFSLSGTLASMAPGLPYAIAAQVAFPERQVVAFVGDGGLLMLGSELSTAAQYRLPIKVIVAKNNVLGMIKWEQMVFLGNPSYGVELPDVNLTAFAEALGVKGFHLERPQDAPRVLQAALDHDGPALVECVVDPHEPPMPPRIKLEQAVHMAEALARGEPNGSRIALTLFRDKVDDLLHPREHEERAHR